MKTDSKVYPDRCAVSDGREQLTWLQLQAASWAVADHVQQLLEQGQHLEVAAIFARRGCLWLAATLGLVRHGVAFVWMGCELSKGREKEPITLHTI